jgi:hypothetical protein
MSYRGPCRVCSLNAPIQYDRRVREMLSAHRSYTYVPLHAEFDSAARLCCLRCLDIYCDAKNAKYGHFVSRYGGSSSRYMTWIP